MVQMTTCDLHNDTIARLKRELAAANAALAECMTYADAMAAAGDWMSPAVQEYLAWRSDQG